MDAHALASFDLFDGFSDAELDECTKLFSEERVLMGDQLTHAEDFGYSFFLVLDGHVKVLVDGDEVARLGPGEYFGEMALVHGERRNATVAATETCRLGKMMTWDFNELLEQHPVLAKRLEAKVAERDA